MSATSPSDPGELRRLVEDAFADRAKDFGQFADAKEHRNDDQDDDKFEWAWNWHGFLLLKFLPQTPVKCLCEWLLR